jgi:hypothetical protein
MNSPSAGVIAVYAMPEEKSSACTIVLPICSFHERKTKPSRIKMASYAILSEKPVFHLESFPRSARVQNES